MQTKSIMDYEGKVFRCFAVYDCNKQQVLISIKRHCGNLFSETILQVQEYVKINLLDSQRNQFNIPGGQRCEWHGRLDEKKNCYFLMMTFPGSQQSLIQQSLLELQKIVFSISNYNNLNDTTFPNSKKQELYSKLDELEQKYIQNFGPEGQPDEIERGSQSQQKNKSNLQFLQSTPQISQIKNSGQQQKIQFQYRKNSVYRCFMIYNVVGNKTLFCLKRGSSKSYEETKGLLINQIKKQIFETTKFEIYTQGNQRSEWYGILDDKKSCYFLMMTFPSSTKKNVIEALEDLKKIFNQIPNYDIIQQDDLERRLKSDVLKQIDNLEIKYFNLNGNEGVPSDDEQSEIRRDFISSNCPQHSQKMNSQTAIKEHYSFNPPEIQESEKNLYEALEINLKREVEELDTFNPILKDAQNYIYVGIGITFFLLALLVILIT
ncbi:unnamed protein product [Paramecium sonneborni]|uniref:Uncharacterized protein n=1 Tax=Paramecium sonneborni TaxID=65129 RepID=A0A8S1M2C4_9CILI|nr:unnamed protein product [Paramecium sonneborni]